MNQQLKIDPGASQPKKNGSMDFEIPDSMRHVANTSVEQAQQTCGRFLDAASLAHDMMCKSTDAMTSEARELNQKTMKYIESNLRAGFDLAQRLIRAKDFGEAFAIQNEFARRQFETFAHQVHDLSCLAQSAQSTQTTVQSVARAPQKVSRPADHS